MEPGTLSITVISAKELPRDTNVSFLVKLYDAKGKGIKKLAKQTNVLRKIGDEPVWNESFSFLVEKGCTGCSVALRSRDDGKSFENLLGVSRGDEKLGKARISESHLREQGGQLEGWYPLVSKHSKSRTMSPGRRNASQGSVHLRVTFQPNPLAADKAREKLLKHFPDLDKGEPLIESYKCSYKESALKYQSGTLFMTDKHLYFYAKSFKLRIPYPDILAVRKAHSALVIPNALEIDTRDGRQHQLTNFVFRDQALALLETRLPSLSYLQPPESSSGRSPQRPSLIGAIDHRSMPQLIRSPSGVNTLPMPRPNSKEIPLENNFASTRKTSGGSAGNRTSLETPAQIAAAAAVGSMVNMPGRSRTATSPLPPASPMPTSSPQGAVVTPPLPSSASPQRTSPRHSPRNGGDISNAHTPIQHEEPPMIRDRSVSSAILPRSAGSAELTKARKRPGHGRTKSDGEAIAAEMKFRAQVGQHVSLEAVSSGVATPPQESAEQKRLREHLNTSLVEDENRRKKEEAMKREVADSLAAAEERRGAQQQPPPMLGSAPHMGTSASGSDLQTRNNKLREELLKQEEMRKLLWDQTIKEKTRISETRDSMRLSSSQLAAPEVSPKRIARRVGVLFILLTLFSMLFSSSLQCTTWRDRIEGVALLAVVYVLLTPALGQLAAFLSTRLTTALLHSGKADSKQAGFAGHAAVLLLELLTCRVVTTAVSFVVPGFVVPGMKSLITAALLLRFLSFCTDQVDDFVVAPMLG